jgi:site-specific DNA-methyltransferase (adenine-specific)
MVLDPFCGSGTTLVAAKLLNRKFIGIDKRKDAVNLAEQRLATPVKSRSALMENGQGAYLNQSREIRDLLKSLGAVVVERNNGIDGFLKQEYLGKPVPVRIQRPWETEVEARAAFRQACRQKGCLKRVLVLTNVKSQKLFDSEEADVMVIRTLDAQLQMCMEQPEFGALNIRDDFDMQRRRSC